MSEPDPVPISYFSDALCVWAYAAQVRIDKARAQFGDRIRVETRFCSVFPDAHAKIATTWKERGSFAGFNAHLITVAEQFPHVQINERLWLDTRPRSSTTPHLFLKAVEAEDGDALDRAAWAVRLAFFRDARDISDWNVLREVAEDIGLDFAALDDRLRSSEAVARLDCDVKFCEETHIRGSPTLVMNDDRQRLYGNVGYRLIEANIEELLRRPAANQASWC